MIAGYSRAMELAFAKMHGAGNDFMVARWPEEMNLPDADTVRRWADRRAGVGFDQLLLVRASGRPELAAFYHIFNADGAEVQQCGNGVRCIARYLQPDGAGNTLMLGSRAGTVEARLEAGGKVSVSLGEPDFTPAALPFRAGRPTRADQVAGARKVARYRLEVDAGMVEFGAVSLGNPHAVIPLEVGGCGAGRYNRTATAISPIVPGGRQCRLRGVSGCGKYLSARLRTGRGRDGGLRHGRGRGCGCRQVMGRVGGYRESGSHGRGSEYRLAGTGACDLVVRSGRSGI